MGLRHPVYSIFLIQYSYNKNGHKAKFYLIPCTFHLPLMESVLQCVAVCCSVLQCFAVCCSYGMKVIFRKRALELVARLRKV